MFRDRYVLAFVLYFSFVLSFNAEAFYSHPNASKTDGTRIDQTKNKQMRMEESQCGNQNTKYYSLLPYEQNSLMYKSTSGDSDSSEINVSMRYNFKSDENNCNIDLAGFNPFFSYTSKSDFFWVPMHDTRFSAPVIIRTQNPAIHFRYGFDDKEDNFYDIGFEHISNGQAFDALNPQNRQQVINAYNTDDNSLLDSISRVDMTLGVTIEGSWHFETIDSNIEAKLYTVRGGQESEVYWGKYANQNVNFADFEVIRIRLVGLPLHFHDWRFNAEMTMGNKGLSTDSWNFMLNMPIKICASNFPFAISAHRGPMNNLSNYSETQNTLAFGFDFWY